MWQESKDKKWKFGKLGFFPQPNKDFIIFVKNTHYIIGASFCFFIKLLNVGPDIDLHP
jgi:hypothetical protein